MRKISFSSLHFLDVQIWREALITGAALPLTEFGGFQRSPATVSNLGAKPGWRAELGLRR